MTAATTLPPGFAALEPFVHQWSLSRTAERAARRSSSTTAERDVFFAAAAPSLDAALDYLDGRDLRSLSPEDKRLMNVVLSFAHVALAVEIQGPDETKSARWRDRMRIDRSTADQGPSA